MGWPSLLLKSLVHAACCSTTRAHPWAPPATGHRRRCWTTPPTPRSQRRAAPQNAESGLPVTPQRSAGCLAALRTQKQSPSRPERHEGLWRHRPPMPTLDAQHPTPTLPLTAQAPHPGATRCPTCSLALRPTRRHPPTVAARPARRRRPHAARWWEASPRARRGHLGLVLRPLLHTVTAPAPYGYGPCSIRLQPLLHTVKGGRAGLEHGGSPWSRRPRGSATAPCLGLLVGSRGSWPRHALGTSR